MKVTELRIKNIGKIEAETIKLDKPLICFYGEIRQGKTTILNCFRWVLGVPAPSDIIRHGQTEATIELRYEGGSISRRWYIGRDGTTKADEIIYIRGVNRVPRPAGEIQKFLNPFMLDQDQLRNMGETERTKFFTELFAVDTSKLDSAALDLDREARELRATIKGYGDIDLTEIKPIDVTALRDQLNGIRAEHNISLVKVNRHNGSVRAANAVVDRGIEAMRQLDEQISEMETRLAAAKDKRSKSVEWLAANPKQTETQIPAAPDTSDIESKISEASANQVRVEQYQRNLSRHRQRQGDAQTLAGLETRQREIKAEKIGLLKGISESCGIAGLAFDESGNFTYQGVDAGMLSTSQIMELSSQLSALYPEGMSVELLDRGESLGKSIFGFIDRAKAERKTILATIVGEKPAAVPDDVGVFVVNDGHITR